MIDVPRGYCKCSSIIEEEIVVDEGPHVTTIVAVSLKNYVDVPLTLVAT